MASSRPPLDPSGRPPVSARLVGLQLGSIALSLVAPSVARRVGRGHLGRWPKILTAGALVVAANAVTVRAERRTPFRADWNRSRDGDLALDITYTAVQAPVVGALNGLIASAAVPAMARLASGSGRRRTWPTAAPLAVRLATALLVSEFSHYWWHRFGHRFGWRWHAVHHSASRLYWLNATRVHPFDMMVDVLGLTVPLLVLGVDPDTSLAYSVFRGTYGKLQHANIAGSSGWLNHVLSTPDLHRWHHSTERAEANTNFGAALIVWDTVFGTRSLPDRAFDLEIGAAETGFPTRWRGQALAPLRSRAVGLTA